jgi:prepilin-type processing-associated H-X9-DG protein
MTSGGDPAFSGYEGSTGGANMIFCDGSGSYVPGNTLVSGRAQTQPVIGAIRGFKTSHFES